MSENLSLGLMQLKRAERLFLSICNSLRMISHAFINQCFIGSEVNGNVAGIGIGCVHRIDGIGISLSFAQRHVQSRIHTRTSQVIVQQV